MKIGIGLPAAIPDVTATAVGEWAASAEQLGFSSVSVIDRLVYDNLDPLIALAAAAEPAPDALAPYVTCLWEHRIGGGDLAYDQPVLPDGCIDLVAVDETLSWPVRRLARWTSGSRLARSLSACASGLVPRRRWSGRAPRSCGIWRSR